jgi:hypothetical protein
MSTPLATPAVVNYTYAVKLAAQTYSELLRVLDTALAEMDKQRTHCLVELLRSESNGHGEMATFWREQVGALSINIVGMRAVRKEVRESPSISADTKEF